jgi:peptide/nickel transport system ATP-binding protein
MLRASRVCKRFRRGSGWTAAVDDVTLEVMPGERVGLLGPSGSGKSTLGQVMALLLKPDAGTVTLNDEETPGWGLRAPRALRRQVQLMWQSPRMATDPRLRLRDIVLEPLAANRLLPQSEPEQRDLLAQWCALVGLTNELMPRHPHEVSEGQLQRACLARALILTPRYLICDELTSMLDVSTQASLLQTIAAEQNERELGVLLITHDRVLAKHWCHRIIEMKEGKLLSESSASDMKTGLAGS